MESSNKRTLAHPTTFNQENTVTLLIGPDKKALIVHEFRLASSEFFKTAMKKEWAEGQTRTVSFLDDDPDDFAYYLDWMYFGNLPTSIYDEYDVSLDKDTDDTWELLARLYVLRERLLNTPFRNALMIEIIRIALVAEESSFPYFPGTFSANIIYAGTPEHSPARRLFVDMSVRYGGAHWHTRALNQKFLFDFMQAVYGELSKRGSSSVWRGTPLRAEDYLV